jgi:hypothetical protein
VQVSKGERFDVLTEFKVKVGSFYQKHDMVNLLSASKAAISKHENVSKVKSFLKIIDFHFTHLFATDPLSDITTSLTFLLKINFKNRPKNFITIKIIPSATMAQDILIYSWPNKAQISLIAQMLSISKFRAGSRVELNCHKYLNLHNVTHN